MSDIARTRCRDEPACHDRYANVLGKGRGNPRTEMLISRLAVLGFGALAVGLAIFWRGLTTAGTVGLLSAILFTLLGPAVWVKVLGYAAPVFPLDPPTLVTLPLAFATCVGVSLLDRSRRAAQDRAGFVTQPAAAE